MIASEALGDKLIIIIIIIIIGLLYHHANMHTESLTKQKCCGEEALIRVDLAILESTQ